MKLRIPCYFAACSIALTYVSFAEAESPKCTQTAHAIFGSVGAKCSPLTIDMAAEPINVPKTVHIPNNTPLVVKVVHALSDSCDIKFSAATIANPSNPLAALLGALVGLKIAPAYLNIEAAPASCAATLNQRIVPNDSDATALEKRAFDLAARADTAASVVDHGNALFSDIAKFARCSPKEDCGPTTFDNRKADLKSQLAELKNALAMTDALQNSFDTFQAQLAVRKGEKRTTDQEWLKDIDGVLICIKGRITTIGYADRQVGARLRTLELQLDHLQRIVEDTYALPLYHDTKLTGNVICGPQGPPKGQKSDVGDPTDPIQVAADIPAGPSKPPVPIEIDYQDPGVISGSAGIVISTLGQHQVGIRTKSNADGTFTTYFAVTNHSPVQFVPVSLVHLFLYGNSTTNLSLSGGIGINPYNGTTQIEYFVGPSFSTHNVYLSVGTHIGRFQDLGGGFVIGQQVPPGWTNSTPVPTTLSYTAHLAFGITYKIK